MAAKWPSRRRVIRAYEAGYLGLSGPWKNEKLKRIYQKGRAQRLADERAGDGAGHLAAARIRDERRRRASAGGGHGRNPARDNPHRRNADAPPGRRVPEGWGGGMRRPERDERRGRRR